MRNIAQEIRDIVSKMTDGELVIKVKELKLARRNIWDDLDPKQFDDGFYQYLVEDMDATIEVYEAIARERGLDV